MILLQPYKSKLCGHYCLAFILNIKPSEAIDLIGHIKGTKTKELTAHFKNNGLKIGMPNCYSLCISRDWKKAGKGNWHWVIYIDKNIYCPSSGWHTISDYAFEMNISSYIPIL